MKRWQKDRNYNTPSNIPVYLLSNSKVSLNIGLDLIIIWMLPITHCLLALIIINMGSLMVVLEDQTDTLKVEILAVGSTQIVGLKGEITAVVDILPKGEALRILVGP